MPRSFAHKTLLAVSFVWCLTILLVTLFPSRAAVEFFHIICHQDESRSWMLMGQALPVCIRCASLYFGAFAGLVFGGAPNRRWLRWCFGMAIAEFVIGHLFFDSELLRTVSGLLLGSAAAPFIRVGVEELIGELWMRYESV
jgi:hypothetical protein